MLALHRSFAALTICALATIPFAAGRAPLSAQTNSAAQATQALKWRMIGPYRGGRTKSAIGVPSQPNVFYIGVINGGVWKTTDYGRVWKPVFDEQPTQSVGAIDVSLSDPNVVFVGSGEGLQRPDLSTGDGIYRSGDAGKTWTHLGLRDAQQIPRIVIDPKNPDRLFVAALGHPYGANTERGVFRSTDGGKSFQKVLYKDENTGAADIVMASNDPNTLYAALWEARQGPWENGAFAGPGTGLFKSTDGGNTWTQLTTGLPTVAQGVGRMGIAISPSNPNRLYITATADSNSGVFRTDDAGEHWARVTSDNRIYGRGDDFAALTVDPKNPDIIYSANVVAWKSTDGGKSWAAHRGAPGGDDYQRYWINPNDPNIQLLVSDQGAVITVNGGESWSSWYNQPTAQFYHVTADNAYPYRLCGGQQESGSACIASRGNDGSIGYREWRPVGTEEYGYVAPDPLNPDIVYGGKVSRFNRATGQTQQVGPNGGGRGGNGSANDFRAVRTAPLLFSPTNPHKLYFATQHVWQTSNGGQSWKMISPDLSRENWDAPKSVGKYLTTPAANATRRGVIYTLAPSPVDSNTIWAGTDDGLIHVTRNNGKTWINVTPPLLGAWAKISLMDASHFDTGTAYAAVNTLRLDDLRPHIFRTRDGGTSWTEIVTGIDSGATTNVVREDPTRKGLLFAGTERQVWFSLDDGDHWQSLRMNLPATSVRDLIIKDNDVAVGTHGRGFWILDDITPLRQWSERLTAAPAALLKPAIATRVRYSMYTDTPVPPDESLAENPPDGAVIDYWLKADAAAAVSLDILTDKGRVVRHYSSDDKFDAPKDEGNWPSYWFRALSPLGTTAGVHRYVWDLHYTTPSVQQFSLPISATPKNTLREPQGIWAHPGQYTVRLTVDGKSYTQPLVVRMDPRVKTPVAGLQQQYTLSLALYDGLRHAVAGTEQADSLRSQINDSKAKASAGLNAMLDSLDKKLMALAGANGGSGGRGGPRGGGGNAPATFRSMTEELQPLIGNLQSADETPTSQQVAAATQRIHTIDELQNRWSAIVKVDLPALNAKLKAAGLNALIVPAPHLKDPSEPGDGDEDWP